MAGRVNRAEIVEKLARAGGPCETQRLRPRRLARNVERAETGRPQIVRQHARIARHDVEWAGWINMIVIWATCHQLGYFWERLVAAGVTTHEEVLRVTRD